MNPDSACDRLCDDIAGLLFAMKTPTRGAAFSAARATRDVSDALHHASGSPRDPRWHAALGSLDRFLDACGTSSRARNASAFRSLREFVEENRDLVA